MNLTSKLFNVALIGSEWVLWLLVALSVVSVAFLIERGIAYYQLRVPFNKVLTDILSGLRTKSYDEALKKAQGHRGVEARVAAAGLAEIHAGTEAVADAMTGEKIAIKLRLERGLSLLGTLGSNAPFIGLFGTVLGIIKTFHDLQNKQAQGLNSIMSGISEALVATGVGLLVAIPAVIGYNFYSRRVRTLTGQMEITEQSILTSIRRNAAQAGTEVATAPVSEATARPAHRVLEDLTQAQPAETPETESVAAESSERRTRPRRTPTATRTTASRSTARKTTTSKTSAAGTSTTGGEEG